MYIRLVFKEQGNQRTCIQTVLAYANQGLNIAKVSTSLPSHIFQIDLLMALSNLLVLAGEFTFYNAVAFINPFVEVPISLLTYKCFFI